MGHAVGEPGVRLHAEASLAAEEDVADDERSVLAEPERRLVRVAADLRLDVSGKVLAELVRERAQGEGAVGSGRSVHGRVESLEEHGAAPSVRAAGEDDRYGSSVGELGDDFGRDERVEEDERVA